MSHDVDPLSDAMRLFLRHRARPECSDTELLTRHPQLRELLAPLVEQPREEATLLAPGVELGDFRLVAFIGRGGMGEVWEAEQISLQRRVALKLLSAERFANVTALERFRREAVAGARLRHPNIVAVYSVGEARGVHFIAQELVDSRRTLDDELQARRNQSTFPEGHWRETAELFRDLALALDEAHRHGVLHRDVKPSNILVTDGQRPKIADFGIALVQGEMELSRTGDLTGSPFYMSPEQAAARRTELDPRSDVFSLGATLYEVLTLVRPFDGDSITQVLNKILVEDPPDPRALRSLCPRDLALICLKMLEKDRDRRYANMREVALDLERHLRDEPIHAKPASLWTRAVKWSRRHPAIAACGSLLVVGSAVLYGQLQRALAAERLATESAEATRSALRVSDEQRELAQRAHATADAQRERAERKVSELEQVNTFLVDVFAAVDQARARGSEPTARDLLERGAQALESALLDQPLVRAGLYDSIGRTFLSLGDDARAQALLERGLSLRAEHGAAHSLESAASLAALAALDLRLSRPAEALARAKEAHSLQLECETRASEAGVSCHLALANALSANGKAPEALEVLENGLRYCDGLPGDARPSRAMLSWSLAALLNRMERREQALQRAEEALALRRDYSSEPHPLIVSALAERASALTALRRWDEARAAYDELLELEAVLSGARSERYASFLTSRARLARETEAWDDERATLQRALSIFEQVASPAHRNALVCRENLMQNLLRSARFAELNALCEATLSVAVSAKLERAHVALFSRMCSAFAHEGLDQLDSAIAVAEGALADFGSTRDPALENRVLYLRCALVDWYVARGDIARAETSLSASGTETEALDSAQSRGQWITWARARLELAQGRPESAAPLLETLAARQRGSSYAWWLPARARAALAELLREKDPQRAHSLAENAEREIRERFGAEHGAARDARTLLERLRAALR